MAEIIWEIVWQRSGRAARLLLSPSCCYTRRREVLRQLTCIRQDTPKMVELVEKYTADEYVILDNQSDMAFEYGSEVDAIVVNPNHPWYSAYDHREIMIHELAHRIDQNEFGSPMNREFVEAILETGKRIMSDPSKYQNMFAPGGVLEYNDLISDIFGCLTDNTVVGDSYHESQYIGVPGYSEMEIFANLFSALYQGNNTTVQFIKSEMGDLYKAFINILEG